MLSFRPHKSTKLNKPHNLGTKIETNQLQKLWCDSFERD